MANEQRRSLRQRLFAILIAGIGSAAASVISYAAAIYHAANPAPLRTAATGEMIDTGQWHITIAGARISNKPPTGIKPTEPQTFLLVDFEADNRSAASTFIPSALFSFDPTIPELPEPTIYLVRDRWIAGPVNPRMPEKLTAAWQLPQDYAPPPELRLLVGSQIYKERDNLYGASNWFDREPVAAVELDLPDAGAEARR